MMEEYDLREILIDCLEFIKSVANHDPHSEINEPSCCLEDSINVEEWSLGALERLSEEANEMLDKIYKVLPGTLIGKDEEWWKT